MTLGHRRAVDASQPPGRSQPVRRRRIAARALAERHRVLRDLDDLQIVFFAVFFDDGFDADEPFSPFVPETSNATTAPVTQASSRASSMVTVAAVSLVTCSPTPDESAFGRDRSRIWPRSAPTCLARHGFRAAPTTIACERSSHAARADCALIRVQTHAPGSSRMHRPQHGGGGFDRRDFLDEVIEDAASLGIALPASDRCRAARFSVLGLGPDIATDARRRGRSARCSTTAFHIVRESARIRWSRWSPSRSVLTGSGPVSSWASNSDTVTPAEIYAIPGNPGNMATMATT